MFHNTTTLHRLSPDSFAHVGKENRMPKMGLIRSIGGGLWKGTKAVARTASGIGKWVYYTSGGEFLTEGIRQTANKATNVVKHTRILTRTAVEGTKQGALSVAEPVARVGVVGPARTAYNASLKNAYHTGDLAVNAAAAPFVSAAMLAGSIGRKIGNTVGGIAGTAADLLTLRVGKLADRVRNKVSGVLSGLNTLTSPKELASATRQKIGNTLEFVTKPAKRVGEKAVAWMDNIKEIGWNNMREIYHYAPAAFRSRIKKLLGSYSTASAKVAAKDAQGAELKAARLKRGEEKAKAKLAKKAKGGGGALQPATA